MIPPQVVDRGDTLAPYRARKAPEAVRVHLCGRGPGIAVLRCHDVNIADQLVHDSWYDPDLWPDAELLVVEPELVWLRWVPDDPHRWDDAGVWERELRGTIGATPAVLFAPGESTLLERLADRPLPDGPTVTYEIEG